MDGAAAFPRPSTGMIRFSKFTPRMGLILAHDLVATAVAVLASFYIRFEGAGLAVRWPVLIIMLPVFVAYAGVVFAIFGLFKSKWRFTSLPDFMNIARFFGDGKHGVHGVLEAYRHGGQAFWYFASTVKVGSVISDLSTPTCCLSPA